MAASAPATIVVLTKKYVAIAATRGRARSAASNGAVTPPSDTYAAPVSSIVMTAPAMLNMVR